MDDTTASGDQEDLPTVYYLGGSAPTTWLAPERRGWSRGERPRPTLLIPNLLK